jgi:hypothetical protein
VDPTALGYIVEEYQLCGVAACYEGVADQPASNVEVKVMGTAPYHTRLLVMRPAYPEHFNHTVLLNWQNVSGGFESFAPSDGELYDGYAWVGVSAQESDCTVHRWAWGLGWVPKDWWTKTPSGMECYGIPAIRDRSTSLPTPPESWAHVDRQVSIRWRD